ncbi:hypothetical protein A3D77_03385 [Candidatus Gottesmanbacteria bacterium RIFCSPHIGHO2_02_FULL_39_11]|uniref:Uncharacterized protein n=1 Tax=Candidatus Gottesmanbacteria bacterium RIFCSPHIGHO2_02_FULL_39_11 TaxID=1798382 RepID=A0A1F5ZNJ7_9BACT|nr:MAG: hypothetical protein A3D77_03385 [Candidatus Gottesmanbacteria bacterium RIFCSPHIGHO2_02_FULL_39_11]
MTPIAPDLSQNIATTIYLIFAHNYIAFAYLTGMLVGIGLAIWKPSRFSLFVFLGFAILLFSFEYDKHIIEPLRNQTITSLVTVTPHYKVSKVIDALISEIFPVLFYTVGWGMVFTSIVYAGVKLGKHRHSP